MKTLLTLTALAVGLSFSSISFAGENVDTFGVDLPQENENANYQLEDNDLYLNRDASYNAFGVQLPLDKRNNDNTNKYYNSVESQDSIVIFGVKLPKNTG